MNEILAWSACRLAAAIRAGQLSSSEVVAAHLARIAEVNPALNAVVQLAEEAARDRACRADAALARGELWGPLHGVPFTVKDSLETAGLVATAGTPGRRSTVPQRDATVVARMRAAGAILLGKTNCTELCRGGETNNAVYGRTNHPYDLARSPGGSSGGEAAIIAAGGSPLGLASDFGGSIRGPAHLCGIVGLNPTMGRVPRTGHIPPYGGAYDTARIGLLARFVEDLALVLPIIAGPDGIDPSVMPAPLGNPADVDLRGLRVAFHMDNGVFAPTPDTAAAVRNAALALRDAGLSVTEDCPEGLAEIMDVADNLQRAVREAEQQGLFREFREDRPLDYAAVRGYAAGWVESARKLSRVDRMAATEFLAWTWRWDACRSRMLRFWERYDVIVCPVDPLPAQPHGVTDRPDFPSRGVTAYTKPYSMAGWPAVVVRGGTSRDGMPIGVQVVAGPWREDRVLAVAQHMECSPSKWRSSPIASLSLPPL